jgi:hypothetical protein
MSNNFIEQPTGPTEGEIFLREFLNSEGIKYISEFKLPPLTGDSKSYRIADFYLPNYNVYIEFLGRWNMSEEDKNTYREKMKVYGLNNIPCIYIYPENLGIIHYTFNYRLKNELKKYNLNKELFRYNLRLLMEDKIVSFFWFALSIGLLIAFQFDRGAKLYWQSSAVVGTIAIFHLYRILTGYFKFFRKDYSYVNFVKD